MPCRLWNVPADDYIILSLIGRDTPMQRWLQKYRTRRAQRRQRSLERWEIQRAHGGARYIFRTAFTFAALFIIANDIADYFSGGVIPVFDFWGRTLRYVLSGGFIAFTCWLSMENKYNSARHHRRTAPADGKPPQPQRNVTSRI
jgi:hypothetical protein